MKASAPILIALSSLLLASGPASAMSQSLADAFYPTYGHARHLSQDFEFLGNSGTAYDGLSFSGSVAPGDVMNLTALFNVGNLWGDGDYQWFGLWIDWDHSHTWELSERAVYLEDSWFDAGLTSMDFSIPVPDWTPPGETWMRARFTFDGPHGPTGDLVTGEVEDYRLGGPVVPEPTSLALLAMGCGSLLGFVRYRRRNGR